MEWWEVLKQILDEKGISQKVFAEGIHDSEGNVSKILGGERKNFTYDDETLYAKVIGMDLGEFITRMHPDRDVVISSIIRVPVVGGIEKMKYKAYSIPDSINVPDRIISDFAQDHKKLIAIEIRDDLLIDDDLRSNEFLVVYKVDHFIEGKLHLIHIDEQVYIRRLKKSPTGVLAITANGKIHNIKEEDLKIIGVLICRQRIHVYD